MSRTWSRADTLRRALGVVCTLVLLSLALGYYRYGPGLAAAVAGPAPNPTVAATESTEPAPSPPTPSSSAAPPSTPSASPNPSVTRTAPVKPPKGLPAGPGTTEPGILLMAAPDADGRFKMTELVRLAEPVPALQLRPLNIQAAGPGLRGAKPIATDIELTADEQPVKLSRNRVSRPQTVTFDAPAAVFEVHYMLRRVTVRTPNSAPGRALGAIGPLVAGVPGDLPVDVVVMGRSVRNLGCPSSEMVRRPCAAGQLPRLTVNRSLPHRTALVIVQLDLPAPQ
ncbi:MAG TPA: hypothetical protein VLJ88_13505 [Propionibacteriaceae bacterium]|nr:hypothetical protein [Propionibacteriaceae bacterium]